MTTVEANSCLCTHPADTEQDYLKSSLCPPVTPIVTLLLALVWTPPTKNISFFSCLMAL